MTISPQARTTLVGGSTLVLALLFGFSLLVFAHAYAAHSNNLVCDRYDVNIGDTINCRVDVTRPSGDTGATHVHLGVHSPLSVSFTGFQAHPNLPYCHIISNGHGMECFNFQARQIFPGAPVPAPYVNLPYDAPMTVGFQIHIDGCVNDPLNTTVANVYNQNSAVVYSQYLRTPPNCGQSTPPVPVAQCNDGIDNDGDGLIDAQDPGCTGPNDNSEVNQQQPPPQPQCNDGIDNDYDGLIDAQDPGCTGPNDNSEVNQYLPPPCYGWNCQPYPPYDPCHDWNCNHHPQPCSWDCGGGGYSNMWDGLNDGRSWGGGSWSGWSGNTQVMIGGHWGW